MINFITTEFCRIVRITNMSLTSIDDTMGCYCLCNSKTKDNKISAC